MNRITVIQKIINKINAKVFLEIGVFEGYCFRHIKAHIKIAVDPKIEIRKRLPLLERFRNRFYNKFYELTSDDFFEMKPKILIKKGLDVVFIDGLHTYEQALKDVLNSLKFLKDNGVIVLHDCNPKSETVAFPAKSFEEAESLNLPGWTNEWSGDVWKTIPYLKMNRKNLKIFVLDCDYGLGIITKSEQKDLFDYSFEDVKSLTYKDLEKHREKMLNLKDPEYFTDFFLKTS